MGQDSVAIAEILPGVHHWTAQHPRQRFTVSSYWLDDGGVAIDPVIPSEGIDWFARRPTPATAVVLSNRHHYRDSGALNERFGCPILVPRAGLHEFTHGQPVNPYDPGDELAGGLLAVEIGALAPDDGALYLASLRALWLADSVVRAFTPGSRPGFVIDSLMDDPPGTKRGLVVALGSVLDTYAIEHVLLAHGEPMLGDGGEQLRQLITDGGQTASDAFA
jgi:hypothetical protein